MNGRETGEEGGKIVMSLTVVISILRNYNYLSIKALGKCVWPLHYKGKNISLFLTT